MCFWRNASFIWSGRDFLDSSLWKRQYCFINAPVKNGKRGQLPLCPPFPFSPNQIEPAYWQLLGALPQARSVQSQTLERFVLFGSLQSLGPIADGLVTALANEGVYVE